MGDQALLCSFANELGSIQLADAIRAADIPGLIDVVSAYVTVAVYFDADRISLAAMASHLQSLATDVPPTTSLGRSRTIPCCYELGPDLERVASHLRLTAAEVIELHSSIEYTVYAIGFCPGFPYLGYLPSRICNVPRLATPRTRVPPGSVGLTGKQTGIYPLERPGGWSLIGRTPLQLVDVAEGYFPLRSGDRVRFHAIELPEYERLQGNRLPSAEPK
jgi:inhibitor of KinA